MADERDQFRRRAAACSKQPCESTEVAGDLALAFAALARRIAKAVAERPALLAEQA